MADRFAIPITQIVNDDASSVGSGWKLEFFTTGTSTNKDTFSDTALTTANANPVVADSAGRFGDIFLESGTYKITLSDDNDVLKWTADPVAGSVGTSGVVDEKTEAYTVTSDDSTKVIAGDASGGAFSVTLLAAATAGDGFEVTILKSDSSANAVTVDGNASETISGATTFALTIQYAWITIRCDGSNWLVVARGHNHPGVNKFAAQVQESKGADIASAATLVLGTDGNHFLVTGSTGPITAITVAAGTRFTLEFASTPGLTHSATLDLPGGVDTTMQAGDRAICFAQAANDVLVIDIIRAAVAPISEKQSIATTSGTSVDATILPGADEVAVAFEAVSQDTGSQTVILQLGDSGGVETSGYSGSNQRHVNASNNAQLAHGAGFILALSDAAELATGSVILRHMGSNVWNAQIMMSDDSTVETYNGVGNKTLSGELTTVRLTTAGGSATFDAGTMHTNTK